MKNNSIEAGCDAHLALAHVLLGLCLLGIAGGVYVRVQALDFPPWLTTDEHHFVENARNYLAGRPDWNDHPPLGKLIMAVPLRWLGDHPDSWRSCALGFGLANIALAFAIGLRAFRSREAALCAAMFVAIDGFLIVYSRTALLDGILTAFALACLLVLSLQGSRVQALFAGAVLGCAASIKLSGVTLLAPLVVALALARASVGERVLRGLLAVLAALLVYYAQYALGLALSGQPAGPAGALASTQRLIEHHAALTEMRHSMASYWYTWWLPTRPFPLRYDPVGAQHFRAMVALGNPLLWWSAVLAVLVAGACLVRDATRSAARLLRKREPRPPLAPHTRADWLLCAAFAGFLSPWVLTNRDSYIYHYLPCYAFALVLLGGAASRLYARRPRVLLSALVLVLAVSVFYAPIWGQFPVDQRGYHARLFLPRWR